MLEGQKYCIVCYAHKRAQASAIMNYKPNQALHLLLKLNDIHFFEGHNFSNNCSLNIISLMYMKRKLGNKSV